MNKEFIPNEQALVLKELGFDEPCIYYIDKNNNHYIYNFQQHPDEFINWCGSNVIAAPTFSQAFRWFREKHGIIGLVNIAPQGFYYYDINSINPYVEVYQGTDYDDYAQAELACLKKLIEIVKENN